MNRQTNRQTDEQTYKQTDEQMVKAPIRHEFLNNDMQIVIYVKFHYEGTLRALKTNLIKKLLPEQDEGRNG